MAVKEKLKNTTKFLFCAWIGEFLYLTGVAGTIPFLFLAAIPSELGSFSWHSLLILIISACCIAIGIFMIHKACQTWARSCKALGRATLIPGFVAVIFFFFSKETVVAIIDSIIPPLKNAEEIAFLIDLYLKRTVPSLSFMIVAYLLVGFILYLYGKRREKGQTFQAR
ncbi:hypothetical protein J4457_04415 [Candidatus Woesearchaeota archaeon]|nr:hypothetical protein [Candidatus Woesearchaeota archaeon]